MDGAALKSHWRIARRGGTPIGRDSRGVIPHVKVDSNTEGREWVRQWRVTRESRQKNISKIVRLHGPKALPRTTRPSCGGFLADDFVWVWEGKVLDKFRAVARAQQGPGDVVSNHLDYATVRFFSDAAVVQGRETWTLKGGRSGHFVFIRRPGSTRRDMADCCILGRVRTSLSQRVVPRTALSRRESSSPRGKMMLRHAGLILTGALTCSMAGISSAATLSTTHGRCARRTLRFGRQELPELHTGRQHRSLRFGEQINLHHRGVAPPGEHMVKAADRVVLGAMAGPRSRGVSRRLVRSFRIRATGDAGWEDSWGPVAEWIAEATAGVRR